MPLANKEAAAPNHGAAVFSFVLFLELRDFLIFGFHIML